MADYISQYTGAEIDAGIGKANTAVQDISGKQDTLVSGENIKTINGNSILGTGNLVIEGGSGGLSSVAHDNTMTGAGTNASPLGVDSSKFATASQGTKADNSIQQLTEPPEPTQSNEGQIIQFIGESGYYYDAFLSHGYFYECVKFEQEVGEDFYAWAPADIMENAYIKPGGGIPKTDLASAVQTSLDKADTAIQDISGKQDVIDSSHKLSADLISDGSTNKTVTSTEKSTWSGKQDALVSGTNIKTINNESILGSGNITVSGGGGTTVTANPTLAGTENYLKGLQVGTTKYSTEPDLSGKVISIMGDSISTYLDWIPNSRGEENDGLNLRHAVFYPTYGTYLSDVSMIWWYKLIFNEFKAKLGVNESWSGSFIGNNKDSNTATYTTCHAPGNDTGPDTCMASITRIKNLGSNGTPDIIYFYGGTNDIAQPGTPGESLGTFNNATDYSTVDLTTTKWSTFVDAFRTAIMRMQYYYPKAKIIVLLPAYCNTYYNRASLEAWTEQMKEVCDYFGVNYIDLRACGITWSNRSLTMGDGNIHPNEYGHTLIADYVKRKTFSILENDNQENVVYTVTNNLTTLTNSTRYIKGVSSGNSYTGTLTGSDITKGRVYMGGTNITSSAYNNQTGVISIASVTGDIIINEGEPIVTPVTGVTLNSATLSIAPGDTETLTATIAPANATNKNVTWSASNAKISISANGLSCTVTGVSDGNATVTVTTADGSYTATCSVTIHTVQLSSIAITTPPSTTAYKYGETFSKTGMVVTASYDDNTSEVLSDSDYTVSPSGALTDGDTTITVSYTYNGVTKTATQAITVATLSSIAVTTQPTKTTYGIGETFDPTGMIITATWSDSSTSTVTGYTYSPNTALGANDDTITISYTVGETTKTTTQSISVLSLSSIAITTAPTKTKYVVGETFDTTGMIVTATWNDNTTSIVTTYTYSPNTALSTSDSSVTISYTVSGITQTATQAITVVELSSIAITTAPTKVSYNEGEYFDPTGMVVMATYSDTSSSTITGYTYSPTSALTSSDTTITVSYTAGGTTKTTTQAITVNVLVTTWYTSNYNATAINAEAIASVSGFAYFPGLVGTDGSIMNKVRFTLHKPGIITIGKCSQDGKTITDYEALNLTGSQGDFKIITLSKTYTLENNERFFISQPTDTGSFRFGYGNAVGGQDMTKFDIKIGTSSATMNRTPANDNLAVDFGYETISNS